MIKIKLIAQGSSKWQRFIKRWGVSFLVDGDILFDTFGDPVVLRKNLRKFHVNKNLIRHVVLSHDHWDHTTGLYDFALAYKNITVYQLQGFSYTTRKHISACGVNVVDADAPREIKENIVLSGKINGHYAGKDIFEQALVVRSHNGMALVVGCAHPGIVEMVQTVNARLGGTITLIVGGLHLKDDSVAAITAIGHRLQEIGVQYIAPIHCSGARAQKVLHAIFGNKYIRLKEGQSIDIESLS